MSTPSKQKLKPLQKCAVGFTVFFFMIGLIFGGIILFTSFDFGGLGGLVAMGLLYGGLFGSILIGSYVAYLFGGSNGK
jgi:hypothetical protein